MLALDLCVSICFYITLGDNTMKDNKKHAAVKEKATILVIKYLYHVNFHQLLIVMELHMSFIFDLTGYILLFNVNQIRVINIMYLFRKAFTLRARRSIQDTARNKSILAFRICVTSERI